MKPREEYTTPFTHDEECTKATEDGIHCGYRWMTINPSIKHPTERGGYVPGGPIYWNHEWSDTPAYNRRSAKCSLLHSLYRQGFFIGLNLYVSEHELPFPMMGLEKRQ